MFILTFDFQIENVGMLQIMLVTTVFTGFSLFAYFAMHSDEIVPKILIHSLPVLSIACMCVAGDQVQKPLSMVS